MPATFPGGIVDLSSLVGGADDPLDDPALNVWAGRVNEEITAMQTDAMSCGVSVRRSASLATSVANNTEVVVPWDEERFDTHSFHDNSTNNSRLTVPAGKGGKYECHVQVLVGHGTTSGSHRLNLKVNGTVVRFVYIEGTQLNAAGYAAWKLDTTLVLAAADYVEVFWMNTASGAADAVGDAGVGKECQWFELIRVSS